MEDRIRRDGPEVRMRPPRDTGPLMRREDARRQLLATALFVVVAFLDLSAMAFFHRNLFIFLLVLLAALAGCWWLGRRQGRDAEQPGKSGARVRRSLVRLGKAILLAALAIALCVLFRRPHMIFERTASGYGLRFYTAALRGTRNVVVPETYRGKPVTEIRGSVFEGLRHIETVQLPSGITQIRGGTFEGCRRLRRIDLPEGVTRVGIRAFCDCRALEEVSVPSTLREIGGSAFRRCTSLKSIRIPEVCSVNAKAFRESPTVVERY